MAGEDYEGLGIDVPNRDQQLTGQNEANRVGVRLSVDHAWITDRVMNSAPLLT